MKIHEYQAKEIFAKYGVPVPKGRVAATPSEAKKIAHEIGGKVVIKAQVYAGGRGKAGGIVVASNPDEAEKAAKKMIGTRLVTRQTSPQGVPIDKVLVEEAMDVARELYLSIVIDTSKRMPVIMVSEAGGVDIEEVAARSPEKILKVWVDPLVGFQPFMGRKLAYGLKLEAEQMRPASQLVSNLYNLFKQQDASMAEINPLVITRDGRILALDAKLNFDDNAVYRHKDYDTLRDPAQEDKLDLEAAKHNISYIRLAGSVGCMVNGAGLAMATMDIIKQMGGEPANFLDVGGGASDEQVQKALNLMLSDPNVKAVLINIFGGILRCDVVARGLIEVSKQRKIGVPLVIRMRGTNVDEGKKLLAESGLPVTLAKDLREAAEKVVAAAKRAK